MKQLCKSLVLVLLSVGGFLFLSGCSAHEHDHSEHSHASADAKPYPLKTCLVTTEAFDHGKPYAFVHEGQEILLCCKDCRADFDKEPAKYLSKLSGAKN
ncbi:MAG: hypothetical protein HY735_13800 [Verrucomicrobia bacterium]|nr:hypothetical protein [Verrucomicrobiota bacterium]